MGIEENIKKLENEKSKNKQVEKISEISFIGNIISENIKNGFKDVYEKTYNSSLLIHGVELLKKMDVVKVKDGYTPIKGHDYFTRSEVSEFLGYTTPVIGKDYFTDNDVNLFLKKVTPIKGINYFDGKDGYSPIYGKDYFTKDQAKKFLELVSPVKNIHYFDGKRGLRGFKGEKGENGLPPEHEWKKTELRFKHPDGEWGEFVDLEGEISFRGGGLSYLRHLNDVNINGVIDGQTLVYDDITKKWIARTVAGSAGVNIQSDWSQSTNTADDYIKNKPSIPSIEGLVDKTTAQSVTGLKTFDKTKLAIKGSSTGSTAIDSDNASAASYTATLPAKTGTVAMTSDITGTNSGTNTGDQDLISLVPKTTTVNSKALSGNITLNQDDVASGTTNKAYTATEQTKLETVAQNANVGVVPNADITGATKTKITYDKKGLVTSGADATTNDIADSTDKRYCTDAQKTVIGNTSGTNTGNNAINTTYSGLVSNATHTGNVTGATVLTIAAKAVTLARMNDMATASLIYRKTAGTGVPEVNTLATLKIDLGLTGSNTGDQNLSGKADLSGATFTGAVVTADHGTASTAQVVSVCYGTETPPTANTTPIGTIFIKYVA